MTELRDGYVVDQTYATKAYPELSPAAIRLMTMMQGHLPPAAEAPRYLELGFGQGLSLNIAAAANPGTYEGIDFIPAHVEWAGGLARASGADLSVSADSMTEFAARPGGEDYDYITMHGVWSWVDDAARAAIARILKRRLKPGGIALISYNTPAGWAPLEPLRQLFLRYSAAAGKPPVEAMKGAIDFAAALAEKDGAYFRDNPVVRRELEKLKAADPAYLVHEYLNEGHRILSFADTAAILQGTGLTYIGASRYGEYLDRRRLSAEVMAMGQQFGDPRLTEMVRDVMQASRFRSDLYVKGEPRRAAPGARSLVEHRFVAIEAGDGPPEVERGKAPGFQKLADRVFETLMADDAAPKSLEELIAAAPDFPADRVAWAVMSLCSLSAAAPARDADAAAALAPTAQALNRALWAEAAAGRGVDVLASPVTGAGVKLALTPQLLLHAEAEGAADPAAHAWASLKALKRVMMTAEGPAAGDEANLAALRAYAETQMPRQRARLARLGAVPPG